MRASSRRRWPPLASPTCITKRLTVATTRWIIRQNSPPPCRRGSSPISCSAWWIKRTARGNAGYECRVAPCKPWRRSLLPGVLIELFGEISVLRCVGLHCPEIPIAASEQACAIAEFRRGQRRKIIRTAGKILITGIAPHCRLAVRSEVAIDRVFPAEQLIEPRERRVHARIMYGMGLASPSSMQRRQDYGNVERFCRIASFDWRARTVI